MDSASTEGRETRQRALSLARCVLLSSLACSDVLGIPGAPRLTQEDAPPSGPAVPTAGTGAGGPSGGVVEQDLAAPATPEPTPPAGSDGVPPVAGLGLSPAMPLSPDEPRGSNDPPPASDPPPPSVCVETTLPVDLILILDNSGSMAAETAAVERALLGWSQRLSTLGLDYRLILLSRHRTRERAQSEAASTSICVEQPLSGLARCPSDEPALGERFFHYSIKIDASDSFEQALAGFAEPDAARLAPGGWSEWLRLGALKAFLEISDADSDLPATQLVTRLNALAPEQFGGSDGASLPGFLFYSMVGLAEKASPDDAYLPEEPIEQAECRSADTSPDNAGEQYQVLSVLTGGLRLPLCRLDTLGLRLERIANDVRERARRCR